METKSIAVTWVVRTLPILFIALAFLSPELAFAQDSSGTEFATIWDRLFGWTTGTLGRILAISMFLVGMGISIARQSLIPVAIGFGSAFALAYVPGVIDSIFVAAPVGG